MPNLLRRAAGVEGVPTLSTFSWTGSLLGANLPTILATAARESVLEAGDLVLSFTGGTGVTYSAMLCRW